MTEQTVLYEKSDGVAILTLNRPEVHNALNDALRRELAASLAAADSDPEIGVVILTGAGQRAFSAGMDLREFASQTNGLSPAEIRRLRRNRPQPFACLAKPTIAAINGLAIGGGLELALMCDILVAADSATFALAEVKRGIIPGNGGTQRLARRVGKGLAMEMILTGRTISAPQALSIGLVEHVLVQQEVLGKAIAVAGEIMANAPLAVRMAKEAVNRGLEMPLADALVMEEDLLAFLVTTEDAREGPRAFAEKRSANWTGR